jgi:hypothetical protein
VTPPAAAAAAPSVRPRTPLAPRRPLRSAPRPRRVSGPARRDRARPGTPPAIATEAGIALALPAALRNLANHRVLDRLIAGKAWIFVVAFALIGIVTVQLALLELNSSIGRALERGSLLQRENAALSIENSELAAGDRVEMRAAHLGMEIVPSGSLHFLTASPSGAVARAAAALSKPLSASAAGTSSGAGAAGSGEASAGTGSGAAGGASSGGEAPSSSPSTSSTSSSAPSSGESAASPAGEATPASGEAAASPASSSPPAASALPSAAPGSGEAGPGGGTQPGPQG